MQQVKSYWIWIILLFSIQCISQEDLTVNYRYCRCKALNPKVELIKEDEFIKQYHVVYESLNNQSVPAILNIPRKTSPVPCVFILHHENSDKNIVKLFMYEYAKLGIATFAIDGVYSGERAQKGRNILSLSPYETVNNIKQQVLDILRGLDFLSQQKDIDNTHLALFGISTGALTGIIAGSIDTRIKTAIFANAGCDLVHFINNSSDNNLKKMKEFINENNITDEQLKEIIKIIEPANFINRITYPVLMLNGKKDKMMPTKCTNLLYEKLNNPKQIKWYNTTHTLPISALKKDSLAWFKKYLLK